MRLGTLLLRDAVITLTQLELSLRSQVLSGGMLGTNLVDQGFLDINTLGRYLAQLQNTPLATTEDFENADPSLIKAVGAEFANHYSLIPLFYLETEYKTLAVAMRAPSDIRAQNALSSQLACVVQPYIAPELRILFYLERYYGIRRKIRFTRNQQKPSSKHRSKRERRSTKPFLSLTSLRPPSAPIDGFEIEYSDKKVEKGPVLTTYESTKKSLQKAQDRNSLADALLLYASGRFSCAALFIVREQQAIGWRIQAPGIGNDALERLEISLTEASVFQIPYQRETTYRGKAISGHKQEKRLWDLINMDTFPKEVLVIPLFFGKEVVQLLYAHSEEAKNFDEQKIKEWQALAKDMEKALIRMVTSATI